MTRHKDYNYSSSNGRNEIMIAKEMEKREGRYQRMNSPVRIYKVHILERFAMTYIYVIVNKP